MTDDNNFRLKYDVINDLTKLKELYDNLILENKNLKDRLNKYINPKSKKDY